MPTNARSSSALNSLERVRDTLESLGLANYFKIDFGDMSRLSYYTGLTFKIYVAGLGVCVGGGGRYDELTGNFGRPEPAIGFVLDLDSLEEALARKGHTLTPEHNRRPHFITANQPVATFSEARRRRGRGEHIRIGSAS